MERRSDEYYIREILNGDSGSFSALVEKYQHLAYSLSLKVLNNRVEAEDSAQEAFIKAYNSLLQFNGRSSFRTWFFRIVYNNAISRYRAQKRNEVKMEDSPINEEDLLETENVLVRFKTEERSKYLNVALTRLDPEERSLLNFYYYEDFSVDEISKITGLSHSNVKTKIFRARKRLLAELTKILKNEVILYYE